MRRTRARSALALAGLGLVAAAIAAHPGVRGTQRVGADGRDLPLLPEAAEGGKPAGAYPGQPAPSPDEHKALYGYTGPYFDDSRRTGRVEVLTETVNVPPAATWRASGLVRNQTDAVVGSVAVTAELRSATGDVLAETTATSAVSPLRPGEPAPFAIVTDVPALLVNEVRYSASAEAAPGGGSIAARSTETTVYWEVPFGARERRTHYPHVDTGVPPFPYVVFGSVRNASGRGLVPQVVAAWFDEAGRVLHTAVLPRIETDSGPGQAVAEGGSSDFAYSNADPEVAPLLLDARLAVWSGGAL